MAPSPRLIPILFLLTISSMQIHARESQFFSKGSATTTTPTTTTTTINNNNNAQDKTFPSKEEGLNKQELYGKEFTQIPTTTKPVNSPYTATTYQPYKTQTQETYTNHPTDSTPNTNTNYYNNNQYSNNNNGYEEHQQNYGETSLQESEYTNMGNQNNNKKYYNAANGYNNDEKQGMRDRRYLNGKYYYDVKKENGN